MEDLAALSEVAPEPPILQRDDAAYGMSPVFVRGRMIPRISWIDVLPKFRSTDPAPLVEDDQDEVVRTALLDETER